MSKLRTLLTGTMVAASVLASAAAFSAAHAESVLRRGNGAEPSTLDPHLAQGVPEFNIQIDLFEGLVAWAADGGTMPGVAESWTISDDGLTYTFKLRHDAKWSNGDPVTAGDFVYSFQRAMDPKTASEYAFILFPIKNAEDVNSGKMPVSDLGVAAPDPYTVVITLGKSTPYFLESLKHSMAFPVHKATVEAYGDQWTRPEHMVSNGPFKLAEWVPQGHLTVVKSNTFHDAADVKLDKVEFMPIQDYGAELSSFRAGELDATYEVPNNQIPWIRENLKDEFRNGAYLGTYYYAFNVTAAPFKDNLALRKALSYAIDRDVLTEKVIADGSLPAYSWVPPGLKGYEQQTGDWAKESQAQRVEEAKKFFAESGAPKDLNVELLYNTNDNHKKIAIAIAAMWKQVLGIQTTLRNEEWKVYLDSRNEKNFQIVRAAWIGDYPDPNTFLELYATTGKLNPSGWVDQQYIDLFNKAANTQDLAARAKIMQQAEARLMSQMPMIPVYHYAFKHLVAKNVHGWVNNIMNYHPDRFVSISN